MIVGPAFAIPSGSHVPWPHSLVRTRSRFARERRDGPEEMARIEDRRMEGTGMGQSTYRQQQFSKVDDLIKDIRIAMLTTVDEDGSLRSRPMAAPQAAFDGAPEVEEAQLDRQVNVSFADPAHQRYVSISGTVTLVPDRQKMEALWSPWFRAWFPGGPDEPNLALLKVDVEKAEYWNAPSNTMVQLYGVVKATLTGKALQAGEHAKLLVDERQTGP
jgi:general stress protein 26